MDEEIQKLKAIAGKSAEDAIAWRRRFRFSAWVFVSHFILFTPLGILFAVVGFMKGRYLLLFCGVTMMGLSVVAILNARNTFRQANSAYRDFMSIREDCLESLRLLP